MHILLSKAHALKTAASFAETDVAVYLSLALICSRRVLVSNIGPGTNHTE